MNRTQYRKARRSIRDNGRFALRWLDAKTRADMEHLLFNIQDRTDPLAERADIVRYCRANGLACNVRQTQARRK